MSTNNQIKSKDRVAERGEVFTAEREVNNMLDLVKKEASRIDARFLEPSCGSGNFLIEVLRRKLKSLKKHSKNKLDYERYSFVAISSMYGIDIMPDNVEECRQRLFTSWNKEYSKIFKQDCSNDFRETIQYLLSKNIICGDSLSMKMIGSDNPIMLSEWKLQNNDTVERKDYLFSSLINTNNEVDFQPVPVNVSYNIHFLGVKHYDSHE